jgi:hypothetical protein
MIVHINACSDVHGRYEYNPVLHATLLYDGFNLRSDMDVLAMLARVKREVFGQRFHRLSPAEERSKGPATSPGLFL